MKNYSIQSFKECLFFIFCLFCFLLLSNNTFHLVFCTNICNWNKFQYKHIVVKQFYAQVSSKDICLFFIILFLCLFSFCLNFAWFHEALLLLRSLTDLVYSYIWKFPTNPRYKLSYKLKLRTTYFCKENPCNIFCFQCFMWNSRKLITWAKSV